MMCNGTLGKAKRARRGMTLPRQGGLHREYHLNRGLSLIIHASFGDAFLDAFSPLLSLAFIVGTEGYRIAVSKKTINEAVVAVAHRGTRTVVSQSIGAMVYAAGGGWLTLPAAVLSGLVYERLAELYEASCLIERSCHQLLTLRLQQQDIPVVSG